METPSFIIPNASDIQSVQAQKTAIAAAAPNELVRTIVYQVLRAISDALTAATGDTSFTGNSIQVPIDPIILARPQFSRVTAYLTARGFTSTINATSLTVSW